MFLFVGPQGPISWGNVAKMFHANYVYIISNMSEAVNLSVKVEKLKTNQ